MRLFRPLFAARLFYHDAYFRIKRKGKVLYLTFDDGPDPASTHTLLNILKKHGIKATFFCTGDAVAHYSGFPEIIKASGHVVGNHGFNHLDGFSTPSKQYIEDVERAASMTSDKIFRPPYGRLKPGQYKKLKRLYKIIIWDLMIYDFDKDFGAKRSLKIFKKKVRPGSIIVLHDNKDGTVLEIIDEIILYSKSEGYHFETLKFN
jgi:peptidoglycan/xylan/chitin deacetylase (PgdA/CDA1 family)